MKTRNGFVSNSSSSSFLIGTNEPLTERMVAEVLDVEGNLHWVLLLGLFAKWVFQRAKPIKDVEKLIESFDEDGGAGKKVRSLVERFAYTYELRASNEDCDGWGELLHLIGDELSKPLVSSQRMEIVSRYGG
jgi:hypothetical protein